MKNFWTTCIKYKFGIFCGLIIILLSFCLSLELCKFFFGMAVGLAMGAFGVRTLVDLIHNRLQQSIEKFKCDEVLKSKWKQWQETVPVDEGLRTPAQWLGALEVSFFYLCFYIRPEGIAAWLAFKVVAKWAAWTNIVQVPSRIKIDGSRVDDLEYLGLRNRYATVVLQQFLVGTIANILVAAFGIAVFQLVDGKIPWMN